jgi:hypothetical protein
MSGTREIELSSGHIALIDEHNWGLAEPYGWFSVVSKRVIYVRANTRVSDGGKRTCIMLHRLITGAPAGIQVDHINYDGRDNREVNLRLCTNRQNTAHRRTPANNTSGYKGVSWHERDRRWTAYITVNGTRKCVGYFSDLRAAVEAYNVADLAANGEFAQPNEIREGIDDPDPKYLIAKRDPYSDQGLRSTNKSGYKGVSWDKSKRKWIAQIRTHGWNRKLGGFDTAWEAAQVVNVAARAAWGEFAYVNERHPDPAEQVSA